MPLVAEAFCKFTIMSEDMHSLLGKYFNGEATEEEKHAVENWVRSSEQNADEFSLLQNLWNRSDGQPAVSFDTEKAWQKVNAALNVPGKKGRVVSLWTRRAAIAVAAMLVLIAGIWWLNSSRNTTQTIVVDMAVKEVLLEDGTKVYLRKGSVLAYPKYFSKNSRRITLSGEAFFEVRHDESRPFTITASDAEVRVVGTSFTVSTNNNKVELIVKTGRVRFGSSADTANRQLVIAGQRASYADLRLEVASNTDPNFDAWQTKQLIFKNTPLKEVAAVISKVYNVTIVLKKEDEAQMSESFINDRYSNQSLESVLADLSRTSAYHIKKLDDTRYEISIQ
jgi:transmembrane sensor